MFIDDKNAYDGNRNKLYFIEIEKSTKKNEYDNKSFCMRKIYVPSFVALYLNRTSVLKSPC